MDKRISVRNVITARETSDLVLMMEQLTDGAILENIPMNRP